MDKILKGIVTGLLFMSVNMAICQQLPSQNCNIIIGIASSDKECTSGKQSIKFPDALGYQYVYTSSINIEEIKKYIGQTLIDKYKIGDNNIVYYSSDKPIGVIIAYQRDIPAWKCSIMKYAVGFGN